MSRPHRHLAAVLLVLAGAAPARAALCAADNPPAATLLLPYFEVDLAHGDGLNTLFSINNASATALVLNVVLWTDMGIPTLSFPVYLTGYDVQTISLRDVFAGVLPATGTDGQDPADTISPQGPYSQDINFASCQGQLPPPPLEPAAITDLRAAHTGLAWGELPRCTSIAFGDGRARGYVTVDTVNSCSTSVRTPLDAGYFAAGGNGRATDQNVLWGDFFLVDSANNFAEGDNLVRIEAAAGAFSNGDTTFYGRFVGYTGADDREPLVNTWSTRYVLDGGFSGGTELLVWRDPEGPSSSWSAVGGVCGLPTSQPWFPLTQQALVIFDEQENPEVPQICPFLCPPQPLLVPFPRVANRTRINSPSLPLPFNFGWMYLDLARMPSSDPPGRSQSWMVSLMSASGRYAVGMVATPLDSSCAPRSCEDTPGGCQ